MCFWRKPNEWAPPPLETSEIARNLSYANRFDLTAEVAAKATRRACQCGRTNRVNSFNYRCEGRARGDDRGGDEGRSLARSMQESSTIRALLFSVDDWLPIRT
jgi:hypothetical protein